MPLSFPGLCAFAVRQSTVIEYCAPNRPQYPMQLLRFYFTCATRWANCPTSILVGAREIRFLTCSSTSLSERVTRRQSHTKFYVRQRRTLIDVLSCMWAVNDRS